VASGAAARAGPSATAGGNPNAIVVSRRQQGNPVLRYIRNVPWQFGETSADYLLSETTCCLFLSLRYHLLHPDYLARRLRELSAGYTLRLVLLLVDSDDAERPVLEVTRSALVHDCTALLAWSVQEAARYLGTLRAYARKPADLIKERTDGGFLSQLGECLTSVRPLNKTDVSTLHATFGSLASMMRASQHELALCPGLGERKVQRLRETFTAPFVQRALRAPPPAPAAEEESVPDGHDDDES
jgi:DNA excision repair protein ERCC-1